MIKFVIFFLPFRLLFAQDEGMSAFKKRDYKKSYDYYLKVLSGRKDDISAKYGAGISAFKNQEIETGKDFLIEVSNSENDFLASKAHYNLANIYKDEDKLEESIYHYKKAMQLNALDDEARINFELLKKILNQQNKEPSGKDNRGESSDKGQDDKSGQDNQREDNNKSQNDRNDQNNQSNDEQDGNERKKESSKSDQNQKSDQEDLTKNNRDNKSEQDAELKNSPNSDQTNNSSYSKQLSDEQIQAEAILNSLKNQEKINQKQKLLKVKSRKLEKDW
mgnify:FL=1